MLLGKHSYSSTWSHKIDNYPKASCFLPYKKHNFHGYFSHSSSPLNESPYKIPIPAKFNYLCRKIYQYEFSCCWVYGL